MVDLLSNLDHLTMEWSNLTLLRLSRRLGGPERSKYMSRVQLKIWIPWSRAKSRMSGGLERHQYRN